MAIKPVSGEIKAQPLNDNFSYLESKTNNISKGAPSGNYATVALLTAAHPNGNTNIYLVTSTGNWHYWDGAVWAVGGKYQETGLADESITPQKLAKQYNYKALINNDDLDSFNASGVYLATVNNSNMPVNAPVLLQVDSASAYCKQVATTFIPPYYQYTRVSQDSGASYGEWISGVADKSITRKKLSDDFDSNGNLTKPDLNTLLASGTTVVVSGAINAPDDFGSSSGFLMVHKNGIQVTQILIALNDPKYLRVRTIQTPNIFRDWVNPNSDSGLPLEGKKIVNFGDSVFGNVQDTSSVSGQISSITGATVYNCGFGGSRMGQHAQYWDAFSFYRLTDELVKDVNDPTKWQLQDAAIDAGLNGTWTSMPSYYPATLQRLKDIDLKTVHIATISEGTNDYSGGNPTDNPLDLLDIKTFGGALRYGLNKILAKYPDLKVLICTPTYRLWFVDGEIDSDSDTRDYAGTGTLTDYVEKTKEIGKEYKLRVSDNYFTLGANQYNWEGFFDLPDGTHHNAKGRKRLAEVISGQLILI